MPISEQRDWVRIETGELRAVIGDWLNRDPDFPPRPPYFFGRPSVTPGDEGMVFMVMLDTDAVPGFAQPSPLEKPYGNVPWDFHVTFPRVQAGDRHGLRARLVYAGWSGPEACRAEYERWLGCQDDLFGRGRCLLVPSAVADVCGEKHAR